MDYISIKFHLFIYFKDNWQPKAEILKLWPIDKIQASTSFYESYWNTVMVISSCMIYSCFYATTAEWSSCNRDCIALKV